MKNFKLTFLLFVLMSMISNMASAYDLSSSYEGNTIYYNIVDGNAQVTYRNTKYNSYWGSVFIPETVTTYHVTSIGDRAFYKCSGLTAITIPSSVTSIGESAFCDCSGLASIEIPSSVTSIGSGAFSGCSGLTSIEIPSSVTSIGNYAFYGCRGLTSIGIPSSVTSIGNCAFYGCRGLTSIGIPSSVTNIGDWAFSDCNNLTCVKVEIKEPVTISNTTFTNRANAILFVPDGSIEAYKSANFWKEFKEIWGISDYTGIVQQQDRQTANGSLEDKKTFFDIQGRRVTNLQRGLYLKNGKKIMKKQ